MFNSSLSQANRYFFFMKTYYVGKVSTSFQGVTILGACNLLTKIIILNNFDYVCIHDNLTLFYDSYCW